MLALNNFSVLSELLNQNSSNQTKTRTETMYNGCHLWLANLKEILPNQKSKSQSFVTLNHRYIIKCTLIYCLPANQIFVNGRGSSNAVMQLEREIKSPRPPKIIFRVNGWEMYTIKNCQLFMKNIHFSLTPNIKGVFDVKKFIKIHNTVFRIKFFKKYKAIKCI